VNQKGITKTDLKPYLKLVQRRIEKNLNSHLWGHLEQRWGTVTTHARGLLAAYQRGQAMARHERIAASEVAKLADHVAAQEVIRTALAMFVMLDQQPRRFPTDPGFRAQLVRRVRRLTEVNVGTWYDHDSGKVKKVYKDLSPRATAVMGKWLAQAFGGAGGQLARLEQRDFEAKQQEQQAYRQALLDLT